MGEGVVQKIWPTLYPGCRYNVELFLREEVGGVCVCVCATCGGLHVSMQLVTWQASKPSFAKET